MDSKVMWLGVVSESLSGLILKEEEELSSEESLGGRTGWKPLVLGVFEREGEVGLRLERVVKKLKSSLLVSLAM